MSIEIKQNIISEFILGRNTKYLSTKYGYSVVTINKILRQSSITSKSQSELQRKYSIDEFFFDDINTEEKAYFLGLLYADGYNNTDRNSVNLSLKESDRDLLLKLNSIIQSNKPLQFIESKNKNHSNTYRLVIANKRISKKLDLLGCTKAKTFNIIFPEWLDKELIRHFIRGYWDGDGWIGKKAISIVGTIEFCNTVDLILSRILNINTYQRKRIKGSKNNIIQLEISGIKQIKKVLDWIYKDCKIFMQRKFNRYAAINLANYSPTQKVCECEASGELNSVVEKQFSNLVKEEIDLLII